MQLNVSAVLEVHFRMKKVQCVCTKSTKVLNRAGIKKLSVVAPAQLPDASSHIMGTASSKIRPTLWHHSLLTRMQATDNVEIHAMNGTNCRISLQLVRRSLQKFKS